MRATVSCAEQGGVADLHIEGITPSPEGLPRAGRTGKPSPEDLLAASLASCTATTMERYARRNGWDVSPIEVDVDYSPAQRGSPTRCKIIVGLPEHLPPRQRERLMQVGATSPVHRTLEGEVAFEERVELTTAPNAQGPEHLTAPPGGRIALLKGLRGALRAPTAR